MILQPLNKGLINIRTKDKTNKLLCLIEKEGGYEAVLQIRNNIPSFYGFY
ncbi:MAG: hypothetical protein MJ252_04530 [archaeon]|nr:hypothetical protein [archaeon]